MTLRLRLILVVTGLLCAAVVATAGVLAVNTRNAVLAEAERNGELVALLLARSAGVAERLPADVEAIVGEQMLSQARIMAHYVAVAERAGLTPEAINAELKRIVDTTALDEIWITDARGHAYLRTETSVDFTFSRNRAEQPQASEFWPLLTGDLDYVIQGARTREIDDHVFKYVGVGGIDRPRIVQVGHDLEYLSVLRDRVGLKRMVDGLLEGGKVNAIWVFDLALAPMASASVLGAEANPEPSPAEMAALQSVLHDGRTRSLLDGDGLRVMAPVLASAGTPNGAALVRLPTNGLQRSLRTLAVLAVAVAGTVLLAGALVAAVAARRIADPVSRITAAAAALEAGRFDLAMLDATAARRDELGRLARVFQGMAREVFAREEHLDAQVRARTRDLAEKNRQLEAAQAQMHEELEMAQAVQQAMLPAAFPEGERYAGFATMCAARQVGGDFYDVIRLDAHRLGIVVADVSGKGVPAAFFMAVARTALAEAARSEADPARCLARANGVLCAQNPLELFVTVFYGVLDTRCGTFRYANGGHNAPYLLRRGEAPTPLGGARGMALGMFEEAGFAEAAVALAPGDTLFLYTDGITEAFDPASEEFGVARLVEALGTLRELDVAGLAEGVVGRVRAFAAEAPQSDDLTCVVLRYGETEAAMEMTLANELREMDRVAAAVERFGEANALPPRLVHNLTLALDELLTNVVSYGYEDLARAEIRLRLAVEGGMAEAELVDDGRPFNPLDAAPPDLEADVDARRIGGLGIHLVRSLMDEVRYSREGDRNRVLLRKRVA